MKYPWYFPYPSTFRHPPRGKRWKRRTARHLIYRQVRGTNMVLAFNKGKAYDRKGKR